MKEFSSLIAVTIAFIACALCSEWECNVTLPWSVAHSDHPVIPHDIIQDLLRCPHELHGCSPAPVICDEQIFAVTCSCAKNCEYYGDCCWDAGPSLSSRSPATCVARNVDHHFGRNFYVISVCDPKWPDDGVRDSCENATYSKEAFYFIPVTTRKMVTYFNAFCALCNYDLDNTATFWNSSGTPESGFQVDVPPIVSRHVDTFLRPCDPHLVDVHRCPEGADAELTRKCMTYFAPVKHKDNDSDLVYKNVYCGLCNGAELSSLKCIPKRAIRETWVRVHVQTSFRPNLVSLMRPVVSQKSCFSWHGDKCYIKAPEHFYSNHSMTGANGGMINITNTTTLRYVAYSVQNYLTIICIGLSLVCLFLKGVVYVFYKSSRSFSTRCTLCLSSTLFWSHLLFLLANSFDVHTPVCVAFAIILHYGFLSTFFWTSLLSFDIWKHVAAVRITSTKRGGFLLYSLIAWGVPMVIVATSAAINWGAPDFVLSPRYGLFGCWIGNLWSQLAFFLMPMMILLALDVGLYVHTVVKIRRTAKRASIFEFKGGGNQSHMRLYVKLAFIMGMTWLLGFVSAFFNVLAMDIVVIVLIGLQGVYLFFGFKDYEHLIPKRFRKKQKCVITAVPTASTPVPSAEGTAQEKNLVRRRSSQNSQNGVPKAE
ncbi:hypothetical protein V5799_009198 [Amblyomma americanum]|uniref:G-protein coupled receptors family 2 profile 2 domain-containing protein n=1 Tax=Amblyomma americanum TaxID=6943 RepID=A0AAQ4FBR8_AMBAM